MKSIEMFLLYSRYQFLGHPKFGFQIKTLHYPMGETSLLASRHLQSGYIGCNKGNGKKLSSSQAELAQATGLADA